MNEYLLQIIELYLKGGTGLLHPNIDQSVEISWENGRGNIVGMATISQVSKSVEISSVLQPVEISSVLQPFIFSLEPFCGLKLYFSMK